MNAASVTVRRFEPADVGAVHGIERAASADPWSAELFAGELSGDGGERLWLVAVDGTELVGFGGLLFVADEVHVMNMAVAPGRQRQGIATRLLSLLLTEAGERGAIRATLEVRVSNLAGLALYRRFGFVDSGLRIGYYPDGEDAIIMWAHSLDRPQLRNRREAPGVGRGR